MKIFEGKPLRQRAVSEFRMKSKCNIALKSPEGISNQQEEKIVG